MAKIYIANYIVNTRLKLQHEKMCNGQHFCTGYSSLGGGESVILKGYNEQGYLIDT